MLMLERLLTALVEKGATFMTMEDAARGYDKRNPFSAASG